MKQATVAVLEPWMQDVLRQGAALLNKGDTQGAANCARRLLTAKPDLVEAHFLVGLIALELEDHRHAIHAFGSVTKLKPDHGAAWAHLAQQFMQLGHANRADEALSQAVSNNDENPAILDLIGNIYLRLGDQKSAFAYGQRALDKDPDSIPYLINMANNHMFFDQISEAEQLLDQVFTRAPDHPNAHWIKAGLRKARDATHLEQMRSIVDKSELPARGLAFLHYAIGKESEDLQDWESAFNAFSTGAHHRRSTLEFDEPREIAMFEAFERLYTRDWLDSCKPGHDSPAPIFVVGQPRTGTTLIERIITAHSQVHSAGELREFGQCVRRLSDYNAGAMYSPELATAGASLQPAKLGSSYLQTTVKYQGDTPRFVDKLPPNYLFIPLILAALPNAKIIHLTRDPMDACFASFKQLFADAYPHSYDQREMARHHARYFKLMAIWRERFGDRFLDVSYEQTATDLEPSARRLIDYLELPWEDACLDFHNQAAAVTTASAVQVRQPAHTRSIGRWRRYTSQLEPMQHELTETRIPLTLD